MYQVINIPVAILIILLLSSCSDTLLPENHIDPFNMTWTSDTLEYPESFQTNMYSIWGSSPNDVWVCGNNEGSSGNLWHYNGNQWVAIDLFKNIVSSPNTLFKVFGFSPDNVWVVGERLITDILHGTIIGRRSLVLQYDGIKWYEHKVFFNGWLNDIWGSTPNNIWVTGWGIVANYNGKNWNVDTVKNYLEDGSFQLNDYREVNDKKYMMGAHLINPFTDIAYYFFKYKDDRWSVADSFRANTPNFPYKFGFYQYLSEDNTLYSLAINGIYELRYEKWEKIKSTFSPIYDMVKFTNGSIIAVGDKGQVIYFDGNTWKQIPKLYDTNIVYRGIWSDGKEIFIIGNMFADTPQKTIVWKAK